MRPIDPADILRALDGEADLHLRREVTTAAAGDARLARECDAVLCAAAATPHPSDEALVAEVLAGVQNRPEELPGVHSVPTRPSRWMLGIPAAILAAAASVFMALFLQPPAGLQFETAVVASLVWRGDAAAAPQSVYTPEELRAIAGAFEQGILAGLPELPRPAQRLRVRVAELPGGALELTCLREGQPVREPRLFQDPATFPAALESYAREVAAAVSGGAPP
jgi:hypothetical protein